MAFLDYKLADLADSLGIAGATVGHGLAILAGVVLAIYWVRMRIKVRLLQEYILNSDPSSPRLSKPEPEPDAKADE